MRIGLRPGFVTLGVDDTGNMGELRIGLRPGFVTLPVPQMISDLMLRIGLRPGFVTLLQVAGSWAYALRIGLRPGFVTLKLPLLHPSLWLRIGLRPGFVTLRVTSTVAMSSCGLVSGRGLLHWIIYSPPQIGVADWSQAGVCYTGWSGSPQQRQLRIGLRPGFVTLRVVWPGHHPELRIGLRPGFVTLN